MVYFVADKDEWYQSYGWLSNDRWSENNDILFGSNSETIEGISLITLPYQEKLCRVNNPI